MSTRLPLRALGCAFWLAACAAPALAGDDHGHDSAPAATGTVLPRFALASDAFEPVGVADDRRNALYLDHFAAGSPDGDAPLDLAPDGRSVPVSAHGAGQFEGRLETALAPGVLSVAATVVAGATSDLLAGELDIHDDAHADAAAPGAHGPLRYAAWLAAGGGGLLLFAALRRRRQAHARIGGGAA